MNMHGLLSNEQAACCGRRSQGKPSLPSGLALDPWWSVSVRANAPRPVHTRQVNADAHGHLGALN